MSERFYITHRVPQFENISKAPEKVVAEEREKGEKYRAMLEKVLVSINDIKQL